jgi:hypothetical protein
MEVDMRVVLLATVLTLGLTTAVSSQMCGGTASGSTGTAAMGCMGATPVDDPFADKPRVATPKASGMMCPCCKMAMGGMKHETPPAVAPKSESPPAVEPKHDMGPLK